MPQLDLFSSEPKPETSEETEEKKPVLSLEKKTEVEIVADENIVEPTFTEQPQEVKKPESVEFIPVEQTTIISETIKEEFEISDPVDTIEQETEESKIIDNVEIVQKQDAIIFEDSNTEVIINETAKEQEIEKEIPEKREPTLVRMLRKDGKPMQKRGRKSFKEMDAEFDLIEIPEDEILFQKQYYSISEVAKWFKVNTSLLRFWETEFDVLKPRKNRKGDRLFRPEDVKNLQLIYHLLRDRKYTIDGAKDYIKGNKKKADTQLQLTQSLLKFKSFLLELKANLQ